MQFFRSDKLCCPNFNRKRVSYYGFLYYISFDKFTDLVKHSNGIYINSYLDTTLDYIILNEDAYYKFINKQFKKYEELYYIYWNSVRSNIIVISELQTLKLCKYDISKLSKECLRYIGKNSFYPQDKYIIMNILSTGWDCYYDQPYQISALKVENGSIADTFLFNIQSVGNYSDILNNMYSIPKDFHGSTKVIEEIVLKYKDFIEDLPIVSCNTYLQNEFIFYNYYNITMQKVSNSYIDILELANNLSLDHYYCDLKNIMRSLNLPILSDKSSSLTWCMSMLNCYETLKKKIKKRKISSYIYNPFLNRNFIFEGIFKKFSRKDVTELIKSLDGKVSTKLTSNTDFFVLSNDSYYNYLNDKKTDRDILAQKYISKGSNLKIVSENVLCNLINNYNRENNITD